MKEKTDGEKAAECVNALKPLAEMGSTNGKLPDGGGYFHPHPEMGLSHFGFVDAYPGISRRDWLAGLAMQAILSRPSIEELEITDGYSAAECSKDAYIYADAMIAEGRKGAEGEA